MLLCKSRHSIMINIQDLVITLLIVIMLCSCATHSSVVKQPSETQQVASKKTPRSSYVVRGQTYYPLKNVVPGVQMNGVASWYGPMFHGRKTSSGEIYDMHSLTAAHKTLPLHTLVKVTNLENQRDIIVRINDRGPFVDDRSIDLSLGAAKKLDMVRAGLAPVKITVLGDRRSILAAKDPGPWIAEPATHAPNPYYRDKTCLGLPLGKI